MGVYPFQNSSSKNSIALWGLMMEWNANKNFSEEIKREFIDFEGTISSECGSYEKSYSIQVGNASWAGLETNIVIINDITHVKNYYKNLDLHKDHLLATVSHELRTPLNGMLAMVDLSLEETKQNASIRDKLEVVQNSGRILLNMINDILDFSMISKGKLRLNVEEIDIKSAIEDCFKLLNVQATSKGIELILIDEAFLKGKKLFPTDGNRLRQILTNLIGNAIKFTFKGTVTVRVTKNVNLINKSHQNDDKRLESPLRNKGNSSLEDISSRIFITEGERTLLKGYLIEVIDTGIGIKPENLGSLFRLFGRLHHDNSSINKQGVGLGLTISQSLVRSLNGNLPGGEIRVESQYGKGSRFFFPLFLLNNMSINSFAESNRQPPVLQPRSLIFGRKRDISLNQDLVPESPFLKIRRIILNVLVVDDDQINLLVANSYLRSCEEFDFNLKSAINGKEAVDLVCYYHEAGEPFDIILMDCNMPIMDGLEASKIIKEKMLAGVISFCPIIAISANVGSVDKDNCLAAGMEGFIAKPYKKAELIEAIRKFSKKYGF